MNMHKRKTVKLLGWLAAALMLAALVTGCKQNVSSTPEMFAVTFSAEEHGAVEATVGGKAITTGSAVQKDTTVVFTAKPTDGYKVKNWTLDGKTVNEDKAVYSLKITKAVTVTVSFEKINEPPASKRKVTFSVDGKNGTVTAKVGEHNITVGAEVEHGATVTFTATPDEGYMVNKWAIEGGSFESGTGTDGNSTAKVKITAAVTVKLSFKVKAEGTVKYTVEHWLQNVADNEYTLFASDNKTGTTGAQTAAESKDYAGFTAKSVTQQIIAADGSTVVRIEYDRKEITLTLHLNGGVLNSSPSDYKVNGRFGADVNIADPTKTGYTFNRWNPELPAKFPAENAEYTAQWAPLYNIFFEVYGGHGTLKAEVDGIEISTGAAVEQGKTVVFTATTEPGYAVKQWTDHGMAINGAGTEKTYTYTVTGPANIEVEVDFVPVVLTLSSDSSVLNVTVKTADGSPVTVEGCSETTLTSGTETTLSARSTRVTLTGNITELTCKKAKYYGSELTALNVQGCIALGYLECCGNNLTAQVFTQLFNDLPQRESNDKGRCILYWETDDGNHTDFTKPEELKKAFEKAKNEKKWQIGYKKGNGKNVWL